MRRRRPSARHGALALGSMRMGSLARRIGATNFVECSAKTKENLQRVFEFAAMAGLEWGKKKEIGGVYAPSNDLERIDFFNNNICERVFWLNTASPLQTLSDIINFVNKAEDIKWQSSISVNSKLVHSVFNSHPLNFNWKNVRLV